MDSNNISWLTNPPSEGFKVPRIKVCGMTKLTQMHELGEIGVQFAGMIFYHKSPRFIMRHLKGYEVKKAKLKVFKIGVFVDASYDEVMNHVDNFGLDMVQLHGNETPYYCSKLSNYISVIKAFRISEDDSIEWKIRNFYDDTDMFMFDTQGESFGGTGRKFNWEKLQGAEITKPFFLSGGIEPTDAAGIKEFLTEPVAKDLFAVDINSRFEISPGVKDMIQVREFVKQLSKP
jgi:phosphoribosylanthranilate isomerase